MVEALRQVENRLRVNPQRSSDARPIAAVGTGWRNVSQLDQARIGHGHGESEQQHCERTEAA